MRINHHAHSSKTKSRPPPVILWGVWRLPLFSVSRGIFTNQYRGSAFAAPWSQSVFGALSAHCPRDTDAPMIQTAPRAMFARLTAIGKSSRRWMVGIDESVNSRPEHRMTAYRCRVTTGRAVRFCCSPRLSHMRSRSLSQLIFLGIGLWGSEEPATWYATGHLTIMMPRVKQPTMTPPGAFHCKAFGYAHHLNPTCI